MVQDQANEVEPKEEDIKKEFNRFKNIRQVEKGIKIEEKK